LIEVSDANRIYMDLVSQKVITRNRHGLVENCIRVTVGAPLENRKLLNALKKLQQ